MPAAPDHARGPSARSRPITTTGTGILLILLAASPRAAAPPPVAVIDARAAPVGGAPIRIDGVLTDPVWSQAMPVSDFVQREPDEGAAPSHRTVVQVAFDGAALYVAVQAFEPDPHAVVGLLTRRDDASPSDWVAIQIDSFHDRRTAYEFGVNAAGVKYDTYRYDDTSSDRGWDAVWEVATSRSANGWQAEFRVPFSQLRFGGDPASVMGFAVSRTIAHLNETATWPLLARSATGYVSSFGELHGVVRSGAEKRLEVVPFFVGQAATAIVDPGDPLRHSPDVGTTMGLDLTYQVAPGLTLAATVNPDFGQVEADPAVVNLGAFETFFDERRPFFVEGSGNFPSTDLFYSRRIGRAPQRSVGAPDGGFVDEPANTTILGAAKLTGKIGNWAIGALHAVTATEHARVASGPDLATAKTPVEPRTQYSVGRVTREFADNSRVSVVLTSTQRALSDDLRFLPDSAMVAGMDGDWRFGGKYSLTGFWTGSTVRGDATAMDRLQRGNGHSFQRPDARHLSYDPTRTTLNGHSGGLGLSKIGGTRTRGEVNAGFRSPGFEVNDLGFRARADEIWQNAWFQVRDDVPGGRVRQRNLNVNQWAAWNFDGDRREFGGNLNSHWTFTSNWTMGGGVNANARNFADRLTRGGPGGLVPGNLNGWIYLDTDDRRLVSLNTEYDWFTDRHGSSNRAAFTGVTVRPMAALSARLTLNVSHNVNDSQWVINLVDGDRTHYLFGHLDQRTVSLTLRVNYTLRPTLTVQIYGQPFVSAGAYAEFKELVDGRAPSNDDRYASYAWDGDPDFRVRAFRMTNVLRWEYRPGSAFFVVWQQGRQDSAPIGDLRPARDLGGAFAAPAENTFLMKISRWFDF